MQIIVHEPDKETLNKLKQELYTYLKERAAFHRLVETPDNSSSGEAGTHNTE